MFSEQDISFITENVNKYSNAEIATILKCKKKQVEDWLYKNGVKRTEEAKRRLMTLGIVRLNKIRDQSGDKNPHWKNGISKNNGHYKRIQLERYPERCRCRRLTMDAVKNGKLKKEPCLVCGNVRVQSHHEDYKKPYSVEWLCRKCHRELHETRRAS